MAGSIATIKLFAIEIDILGVPYLNNAVQAQNDVVVEQGEIKITIPKGAILIHNYTAKEAPFYSLQIVGFPFEQIPFMATKSREYFLIHEKSVKWEKQLKMNNETGGLVN